MLRLEGIIIKKVVLITGASSGIGRVSAIYLAEAGFIVYAGSRTPDTLLDIHQNLYPIFLDLSSTEQIQKSIETIYHEQKALDVIVNNAGYGLISAVENASEEEMQKQFDINVFSIFRVCKASIPYMKNKKEGGVIINIGSYFGKVALPLFAFYSASKFAVEGLTDALNYELKGLNIRVHSVLPSYTKSNFTDSNLVKNIDTFSNNSSYKKILDTIPQLMNHIDNGNNPTAVAQTILNTINDNHAAKRVYVEGESYSVTPLKDELADDEEMLYRFYRLEVENKKVDTHELKIAMDAKEILLNSYVNPPKIEYLAKLCATNKTKLNRAFQNIYKVTIANYVKNIRLEKAYLLLQEQSATIGDVGKKVGYLHQGNFSKLFYEKYGLHPKEIRSQNC